MSTKKIIFFVALVVCLVVADWVYHLYRQPRAGVADQQAVATLTATDLYQAYSANEQQANSRFLGKVVTVTGVVQEVQQPQAGQQVVLLQTGAPGVVSCSMRAPDNKITAGASLHIKGK